LGRRKETGRSRAKAARAPAPRSNRPGGPLELAVRASERVASFISRHRRWLEVVALVAILVVALGVRLEDLRTWPDHPQRLLYQGEPLLANFDGYYYLALAQDLLDGTYGAIDLDRNVPVGEPRPSPPPLLSVLAAALVKLTPWSLNWIGALLPVLLGLTVTLPLYALGRSLGGPVMAVTALLFLLLAHTFLYRTGPGWFDTDCMNVTWTLAAVLFAFHFATKTGPVRYLYFFGSALCYGLFLWWWHSTPAAVTAICLLPPAVAVVFFYRPRRLEGAVFFSVLAAAGAAVLLIGGTDLPLDIARSLRDAARYITTKELVDPWPPLGLVVAEQASLPLAQIIVDTTATWPAFAAGILGLAWLAWRQTRRSLLLLVLAILGGLALSAGRFLIFLAPLMALGLGAAAAGLWRLRQRYALLTLIVPALVALAAYPALQRALAEDFPPMRPTLAEGLDLAAQRTPQDAVIWALWEHGYTINYWARRGTVGDGEIHDGHRTVYNCLPLATHSERLAANLMRFIVGRGMEGVETVYQAVDNDPGRGLRLIKSTLEAGPGRARAILERSELRPLNDLDTVEDWLRFLYPAEARPVYLLLDIRLCPTSHWWGWFGTWDTDRRDGTHPRYRCLYNVRPEGDRLVAANGVAIDLRQGLARVDGTTVPLQSINILQAGGGRPRTFQRPNGALIEVFPPAAVGAVMDRDMADTVFNRLFIRHERSSGYFAPVALDSPEYQLWEVRADRLRDAGSPGTGGREPGDG
jgi:dolichyl-diphosphooligosaccharide--protein glycosyltransferase